MHTFAEADTPPGEVQDLHQEIGELRAEIVELKNLLQAKRD